MNHTEKTKKYFQQAAVLASLQLDSDIYSLTLETVCAKTCVPGQFVMLYPRSQKTLLPRPISICDADPDSDSIRLVYRVVGDGSAEFSRLKKGDGIKILSPLGNGFPIDKSGKIKKAVLFGGGIGIPPMLYLAKRLHMTGIACSIFLGYRGTENSPYLLTEFDGLGDVYTASDSGTFGYKGTVLDAFENAGISDYDICYACGPLPMLKSVKDFTKSVPVYLSIEEHMACGVGACLGCMVKTKHADDHFKVCKKRICADGPVFSADEVEL